jgi:hypothetical protein
VAAQSGCLESRVSSLVCMAGRAPSRRTIMVVSASGLCHSVSSTVSRVHVRARVRAVPLPAAAARESSRVFKHTSHMDMCNMYMHMYMCMYAAHGRSG